MTMASLLVLASVARLVDPFVGTSGTGHTTPAAACPFGRIQAGPDTGNGSWAYCGGYRHDDAFVTWFSQNHVSGSGRADFGDVALMPFATRDPGVDLPRVKMDKASEVASPGYYAVTLAGEGIRIEATATPRAALWRFTFRPGDPVHLVVDPGQGLTRNPSEIQAHVAWSDVRTGEDGRSVVGTVRTRRWVDRLVSFKLEFDRPWAAVDRRWPKSQRTPRFSFAFSGGRTLLVKVSLSGVDADGAAANLARELPGWDFDGTRAAAEAAWEAELGRVVAEGPEERLRVLYAALYHLCLQPNDMSDVDGRYRGADDAVRAGSPGRPRFSTLSLWDTFRAAHPLYTILQPARVDDLVNSMLDHADEQGYLPIWPLWCKESHCMIANHAVPVVVDAYLKGFRGFDAERAWRAVKTSLVAPDARRIKNDVGTYARFGYVPHDRVYGESVSRTLEMAYDDACAARFAAALGKGAEAEAFRRRAGSWRNLFDAASGFMRPRDSDGRWVEPFNPRTFGGTAGYTEGNAWQYAWHVMHDLDGLAAAFGGRDRALARLSALFEQPPACGGGDITGVIGQYVHGNETDQHVPYLFAYWGARERTEVLVNRICDTLYRATPDGICGNEDCGQMSAWFVFACLGFYPVDPCGGDYVVGVPQLPSLAVALPGGKTLRVVADGLSAESRRVLSVSLNGRTVEGRVLRHADLLRGGELRFTMSPRP